MRSHRLLLNFVAILALNLYYAEASAAPPVSEVRAALEDLETWLRSSPHGNQWRAYLGLDELHAEVAKGDAANPEVIERTLKRLEADEPGLDLPRFARLRAALAVWWEHLAAVRDDDLAAAARAARGRFSAPSPNTLSEAGSRLRQVLDRLNRYLAPAGAGGRKWGEYLRTSELADEIRKGRDGDAGRLKSILQQFIANEVGLERQPFASVGDALREYIDALEVAQGKDLQAQYDKELDALAKGVEQYSREPNDTLAAELGERLGWLGRLRTARPLVTAVRRRFAYPNLYAQVSEQLLGAGIERPIDEVAPVYDVILGTRITGTGHTRGRVDVDLVPNARRAIIATELKGTVNTNTVGRNGPATIYSTGTTDIYGAKQLVFDNGGLTSNAATACADTDTCITCIAAGGGGLLGRIIQKAATKRVYQSKAEAERIAASHAAQRVRGRMEREVQAALLRANTDYMQKFRNPLLRRREFPSLLQFSTTDQHLYATVLQANRLQIGASTTPPKIEGNHDLALQVHETLVNNATATFLAGKTLTQEQLEAKVIQLRGSLPPEMAEDEDREPWSITFALVRPVTVQFFDNGFEVTIRGRRYTSGEREFRAMNVTARYQVERHGNGARLVRQGELRIFPPGFVEGRDRFSLQQQSLRAILQKKFGKLFKPEIVSEGLELPGRWKAAGRLALEQLTIGKGWLALAWRAPNRPEAQRVARAATAVAR